MSLTPEDKKWIEKTIDGRASDADGCLFVVFMLVIFLHGCASCTIDNVGNIEIKAKQEIQE